MLIAHDVNNFFKKTVLKTYKALKFIKNAKRISIYAVMIFHLVFKWEKDEDTRIGWLIR